MSIMFNDCTSLLHCACLYDTMICINAALNGIILVSMAFSSRDGYQ